MDNYLKFEENIGLPDHMTISQIDPENPNNSKGQKSYTVTVNPASYSIDHSIERAIDKAIGDTTTKYSFNAINAKSMSITLLFDSTGSLPQTISSEGKTVLEQIHFFLDVAFDTAIDKTDSKKTNKKPEKKLHIIWGQMLFEGIMSNVKITYSHFDSLGNPIRAKAVCTFSGGKIGFEQPAEEDKSVETKSNINVDNETHGINAVIKEGDYITILSDLPKESMPKSLRNNSEIAKITV
ncbi:MAG: hypothetical protein MK066_14540 [Crocinitomicaceae bacterium]|nr:hypothetical protein [Crocinitomicaceae bacterium]